MKIGIVTMEDLSAPTSYYIELMAKDKKLFEDYAKLIRFDGTVAVLKRFPEWKKAAG